MKKCILFIQFLCLFVAGNADDFKWKTQIDSVTKSDFYKILLSPNVISGAKSDYSDLRILDSRHKEVPYLFVSENHVTEQTAFKQYKIVENKYLPKQAITRIVIHNQDRSTISNFVLQIRNTEIEKEITLKGSDDHNNWFIIKRNFPVLSSISKGNTSELRIIDFPKSNYEFFEITLNDKRKDPLQIMTVGYYDSKINEGLYTEITTPTVHQSNSVKLKKSFVRLTFNEAYEIDRFDLTIKEPDFYMRNCIVGRYNTYNRKKVFETINSFVITSGKLTIWNFNGLKTNELIIEIDNADNNPLQITAVNAYQLSKYLISNLKAGEKYELFYGNEKIASPNYDLQYFTDKIPKDILVLKTNRIVRLPKPASLILPAFFTKTYIWLALVLVIALLGWLSIKITREMKAEKDKLTI